MSSAGGRLRLYLRHATRSLRRGGQRTVLAVFCIAVGVMAVVALRLAGDMIGLSVTGNIREVNGGDVSVESTSVPLTADQLSGFMRLQQQGVIQQFLPVGLSRALVRKDVRSLTAQLHVLDQPSRYPLVGRVDVSSPPGGSVGVLLRAPDSVLLAQFLADDIGARLGDHVELAVPGGAARRLTLTGILRDTVTVDPFTTFVGRQTYAAMTTQPERYGLVFVTTAGDAQATHAAQQLRADFPAASVQTVKEALDENVQQSQQITQYLEIVGLLALLIGGVGIVNTMLVSLSRRRVEIAMLKAAGYRRSDLYALFALEAATLGLIGGVMGTLAGVGVSALVRILVQRFLLIDIVFHVSSGAVVAGVVVGVATALIFGLLPIVRAAAVRPQAVLRDLPEGVGVSSRLQTVGLYALLILLFTILSAGILGDRRLAFALVLGALFLLLVLAGGFAVLVTLVGRLPVPERPRPAYLALVTSAVVVAALVTVAAPAVGAALLVAAVFGYVVIFVPRRLKTSLMLALRSLRRTRGRTATTLVALFAGVFTIGLVLVLGQNISSKINDSLTRLANFSVFAIGAPRDAAALQRSTSQLPGLLDRRITEDVDGTTVSSIDGRSLADVLGPAPAAGEGRGLGRLQSLGGVEGYDLAGGQLPSTFVVLGRALTQADAGSDAVIVRNDLRRAPVNLRLGDSVVLQAPGAPRQHAVHVVGFYALSGSVGLGGQLRFFLEPVVGDRSLATSLGGPATQTIVAMRFDPRQKTEALRRLESAVPGVAVLDLADIAGVVAQVLGDLVVLLTALASLALFAGLVIIGNTVALAMLERRREIGILKAVGHSSRSVLTQVLIENGLVGAIGGVAGMAVVTAATYLLGSRVFNTDLAVATPLVLVVISGITVLTVLTAALVAWGPTRTRPLEVLRYE